MHLPKHLADQKTTIMIKKTLTVALGDRSYPIIIGDNLLQQPELLRKPIRGQQACIISNETVAPLYLDMVRQSLADLQLSEVILPDGERYKTLQSLTPIYDRLLQDKHNRTTTLIALGGGVIGDITGFAAATYQRGVSFVQIPTTLLAQVDSSVGGKTGVNHPLGKNMIGSFHQPCCVIADTSTLNTLPEQELSAGLAEVIKYGLIRDHDFYQWLHEHIDELMALNKPAISQAIIQSCRNKAAIVADDERESGIRATLNLGHTFGHAIETVQGYGQWLHGEAVAAGMVLAAQLSARLGYMTDHDVEQLKTLLQRAKLPITPPPMTAQQFLDAMKVDKKTIDGQLHLVLLKRIGEAFVTNTVQEGTIRAVLLEAGVA